MQQVKSEVIFSPFTPEVIEPSGDVAVIRTTDRNVFRKCRRQWSLSSHLKRNLGGIGNAPAPLWFGSGIHYALEDMYSDKKYATATIAFLAYVAATSKHAPDKLPIELNELIDLGTKMLDYHDIWLSNRDFMPTYIFKGQPQVEVNIKVEIPKELIPNNENIPYKQVFYSFQLDRVSYDQERDGLWIVEYKTAKNMVTHHLINDPQVTAYSWAASQIYDLPVLGICYQQHKKSVPKEARVLKNGSISGAKGQATTRSMYRKGLIDMYGDVKNAPADCVKALNYFATLESEHHDNFIRRDFIFRNDTMIKNEAQKILQEASEILNPNLFLYPSPDRMGCQMCSFNSVCVSMDDGSDWEYELGLQFEERPRSYDSWRKYLPDPEKFNQQHSA